jgi:ABC-type thiamine transport system substrate-binding protein
MRLFKTIIFAFLLNASIAFQTEEEKIEMEEYDSFIVSATASVR